MLPKVYVLALGGTIAMTKEGDGAGVRPTLTADSLVRAVPELDTVAQIEARSFLQVPGAHLSFNDLVALSREIRELVSAGAHGVVITQGTDTIEETSFALDLLLDLNAPVVVTGAMRNPVQPGADGPANLLAAVRVAASPVARGAGVLVVMNDEIHAAALVHKTHTASPSAFHSTPGGPIGWVAEDRVRIVLRPAARPHVAPAPDQEVEDLVALYTTGLGDRGWQLSALQGLGYKGLVVEALGAGHVPPSLVDTLAHLAERMPVVLASRTGGGETFRQTYGFPGSEIDLLGRGLIPAGFLGGPKARILLNLLLHSHIPRSEYARVFDTFMVPEDR